MNRRLAIFRECLRVAFSNALAYRANFVMSALIVFLSNALFPIVTILIYGSGAGFPGWSFYEVLLIQAVFTLSAGISAVFFRGVFWQTNLSVREGTFEIALLKPLSALSWMMASSIDAEGVGVFSGGAAMAAFALAKLGAPSPGGVLAFLLMFAAGALVMLGVNLVMAATSFRWVGNSRIPEIFDSALGFAKYPQSVFPRAVRGVTAFVLPASMIGFFPASALLGRTEPYHYVAVIPCALFAAAGIALYRAMVRRYEGTGG